MEEFLDDRQRTRAFIEELEFSTIETFSLLRSQWYLQQEMEFIELCKKRFSKTSLLGEDIAEYQRLRELCGEAVILDDMGELHPSAEKTHTFSRNHEMVSRLVNILSMPFYEAPYLMCAPEYRDAILFFDGSGNCLKSLNVCLSCYNITETKDIGLVGDKKIYPLLRKYFTELGHDVELR